MEEGEGLSLYECIWVGGKKECMGPLNMYIEGWCILAVLDALILVRGEGPRVCDVGLS